MLAKLERRPPAPIFTRSFVPERNTVRGSAHDRLPRALHGLVMDRVRERNRRARRSE